MALDVLIKLLKLLRNSYHSAKTYILKLELTVYKNKAYIHIIETIINE